MKEGSNEYLADLSQIPAPELKGHLWKQMGSMLVCQSCPHQHASHIPPKYVYNGINDKGEPTFRQLRVVPAHHSPRGQHGVGEGSKNPDGNTRHRQDENKT